MSELIKAESTAMAEIPAISMLQIIQQAAMNPDVDIDKMERLLAMKEKMDKQEAEAKFNAAMSRAQGKMLRVAADAYNPQTKSKYASYASLDRALRPVYTEEGFALSFDTGDAPNDVTVRVVAYVSHEAGFTRQYHVDIDASGKGAKGGDVMTKTHATGSAMQYGMRYLLKFIFNVAVGVDEDDGNQAGKPQELITEDQANTLHSSATETGTLAGFEKWLKTIKVDSISQIRADKYEYCLERLNNAIKARQEKAKKNAN